MLDSIHLIFPTISRGDCYVVDTPPDLALLVNHTRCTKNLPIVIGAVRLWLLSQTIHERYCREKMNETSYLGDIVDVKVLENVEVSFSSQMVDLLIDREE